MASKSFKRILPYANLMAMKTLGSITPDFLGAKVLRREFAKRLVEMRGLPMKMAQIKSMSSDAATAILHQEAIQTIQHASKDEVLSRIKKINIDLFSKIIWISDKANSASLSQVHKVLLKDGRTTALKLKHQDLVAVMNLDQSLMDFLISTFGAFKKGFDLENYRKLLTQELAWELDYAYEVERQLKLKSFFSEASKIIIPTPYFSESGSEHILMDWEESVTMSEIALLGTREEREMCIQLLAEFHFKCLFEIGLVHADPNPGNFGVRKTEHGIKLIVYDFGSVIYLDDKIKVGLRNLMNATLAGENPLQYLLQMGFTAEPLIAIEAQLLELCQILFEPFFSKTPYDLSKWNRSEKIQKLLGADRWNFMVAAPSSVFYLIRAFHGLFYYWNLLDVRVCLYDKLFCYYDKKYFIDNKSYSDIQFNSNKVDNNTSKNSATKLRISIIKNGEKLVSITLPCDSVNRLAELMDPDLLCKLAEKKINIVKFSKLAKANLYQPMEIFEYEIEKKKIKIWLE